LYLQSELSRNDRELFIVVEESVEREGGWLSPSAMSPVEESASPSAMSPVEESASPSSAMSPVVEESVPNVEKEIVAPSSNVESEKMFSERT